jgi:glucose-1-phosphate thymidylyltransferase
VVLAYTLTIPKPLIPIAGKSIDAPRLVERTKIKEPVTEVAFILGDEAFFGASSR